MVDPDTIRREQDYQQQRTSQTSHSSHKKPLFSNVQHQNQEEMHYGQLEEDIENIKEELEDIKSSNLNLIANVSREVSIVKNSSTEGFKKLTYDINMSLRKKDEMINFLKKSDAKNAEEIERLKSSFMEFSKYAEERIESVFVEMSTLGGVKKSKANG